MNEQQWMQSLTTEHLHSDLVLEDGSSVAVIGGGPAGSFFSYFLLDMAERIGLDIQVDIYEPRDFLEPGPRGCNMCGGIISESLVQMLATEGIILPPTVVQRGIDSYVLHMDVGSARIDTPLYEKRIGAVYRGSGPNGIKEIKWGSFDGHLQGLAVDKGAQVIRDRVTAVRLDEGKPVIDTRQGLSQCYELLCVSIGVNSPVLRLFKDWDLKYQPPQTVKTVIREYYFGADIIENHLGSSMHVFLLDLPRLEFAAIIPKGDYVSVCMLGEEIDQELVEAFLSAPEVKACFPPSIQLEDVSCQCAPRINIGGVEHPYGDRIVFVGDSGVTRLYKDGIGAAYRTSKAAATTAILHGISSHDFEQHYWPACKKIVVDNSIGNIVFMITRLIQRLAFTRRAVLHMVIDEQQTSGDHRHMSTVLWDTFTGSAPYHEIFMRSIHPMFLGRFLWNTVTSIANRSH